MKYASNKNKVYIECNHCNKIFNGNKSQKFCSTMCREYFSIIKKYGSFIGICKICNKEFDRRKINSKDLCSRRCISRYAGSSKTNKICKYCNKEFIGNISANYCSNRCKKEFDIIREFGSFFSVCRVCNKEFDRRNIKSECFCSKNCASSYANTNMDRRCKICDKIFTGSILSKFCSNKCRDAYNLSKLSNISSDGIRSCIYCGTIENLRKSKNSNRRYNDCIDCHKENKGKILVKIWADPKKREQRSLSMKQASMRPKVRAAKSEGMKKLYKDPNIREDILERSNETRKKNYKDGKYNFIYNDIRMRSSWEIMYAQHLDENNIKWEYEPKWFRLEKSNTSYMPDFYLPETNEYIEIKGYMRQENKEKMEEFKEQYNNIKFSILFKKDLQELGINV